MYERLRLTELKQKLGWTLSLDTLLSKQNHTAFGNVYWGNENYLLFNNSIQNTLSMYRILKGARGHDGLLIKISNYFLEKKKDGHWRNTYESSLILQTILPDILAEDPVSNPAILTIKGNETLTVKQFPFYTEIKNNNGLSVSKQGGMPVYFTAYEQHWNKAPEKVEGNFVVSSAFDKNGQSLTGLKAGVPVTVKVTVNVKAESDYVMIEIPIPAGCSYYDKSQPRANDEVHREYFKNKVSIFCNSMSKGVYQFNVSLQPRYTGIYHLNPAKAELMYFPVFNGREEMKRVRIE